ncbi:MAG: hypothetical protein LBQ06_06905 [Frankiaceae bacterium]|jgi:antitoxin (DNA-binding transcriptional repressor) of toxin-antitoxin stability system|nr:hypothetical protein [Frankiaceae bacterium]
MATSIPARELRTNYRQIIDRVRGGERITVLAEGAPAVDPIPHVADAAPPRFRAAQDRPAWAPLSAEAAAGWAADIRARAEAIDQDPVDGWQSR